MSRRHLALTLACAVAIAACGASADPSEGTTSASPTSSTTATTLAEASPTTATTVLELEATSSTTVAADDNGSAADPSDEAAASDEPVGEVSRDDRAVEQPAKAPERVPASDESAAVGEVPSDILAAIVADAANHAGTAESEFSIVRSEQVVWNDGSLGCPEPGVYYTQATVSGYWVVLDLDGVQYDYRVRQNGLFRICSSPSSGPSTLNG